MELKCDVSAPPSTPEIALEAAAVRAKAKKAAMVMIETPLDTNPDLPCNAPCPKCGSTDVWREFWKKGDARDAKKWGTIEGKYESVNGSRLFATRDHLRNHCRCCQYDWKSLPLKPNA